MVDILIQGGETEAAANEVAAAIRDIFSVDPLRTAVGSEPMPGTRTLGEAAMIILAVPPAIHYTRGILADLQLGERLQRLIGKATALRKTTRATILIRVGNDKPIPLEEASRDAILAALKAVEQRLKS